MMQKYLETKEEYKDCILFYRLGDFYEMFFDDAKIVSKELELTLTGKSCGLEERAPMCGVPFHAVDGYLDKLISRGYKVAICEQVEDPAKAKGLVKRDIIRVVTPGTVIDAACLDDKSGNYLCGIYLDSQGGGAGAAGASGGGRRGAASIVVRRIITASCSPRPFERWISNFLLPIILSIFVFSFSSYAK